MPAKYNRFLITTCVSVMAFSFACPAVTYAGFEWTPPNRHTEEPDVPVEPQKPTAPISNAEEMDIMDIDASLADQAKKNDSGLEADITGRAEHDETVIEIETVEEHTGASDVPVIIEEYTQTHAEAASSSMEGEDIEGEHQPDREESHRLDLLEPAPTEDHGVQEKSDDHFTLNPFPLEEVSDSNPQREKAVYLPADEDMAAAEFVHADSNTETIAWNDSQSFDIIEGFGSDMPLALVLTQVAPAHYAFSFGDGVNPGAILSWEGGEPWNIVLRNALDSVGYSFSIHGKRLSIKADRSITDTKSSLDDPLPSPKVEKEEPESQTNKAEIKNEESHSGGEAAPVKRGAIFDPGVKESTQPEAKMLSDEKKNIENEDIEVASTPSITPSIPPLEIHEPDVDDHQESQSMGELASLVSEDLTIERELGDEDAGLTIIEIPTLEEAQPLQDNIEYSEIEYAEKVSVSEDTQTASILDIFRPGDMEMKEEAIVDIDIDAKTEEANFSDPIDIAENAAMPVDVHIENPVITERSSPSNKNITRTGKREQTLYDVLLEWSEDENIEFVWNYPDRDIELSSNIFINGTFQNAVDVLLSKGVKNAPDYEITIDPYRLTIH